MKYQDMDSEEKLSFDRELKILKESNYPFIIEYIEEFLYSNGQLCIITEFAPGGTLKDIINNKETINQDEIMSFFTMILLALNYL